MNISEFDIAIESIFGDSFIGQKLRSLKMDFVSKKLINKFPGLDARRQMHQISSIYDI